MTSVPHAVSRLAVPREGIVTVPCYQARAFNGRTALLAPMGTRVPFDFASLTERDFALLTGERGEAWTVQALIAVDVDWLVEVLQEADRRDRTLGVEIADVWYYVSPVHLEPTVVDGRYVVVGLYR